MSFAFEVTHQDVLDILQLHDVADSLEDELVDDGYVTVVELEDRITEAVLEYTNGIPQRMAALREIEAILIEEGLLDGPPRVFGSPHEA